MHYAPKFKQTFIDFIVEEHLPYTLAKRGTWYYVQLEKRNINTMDMVKQIMKTFALTRKKIGIAGLKDKHALATQWVCFHSNDVKKIGEHLFLNGLGTFARVIKTGYAQIPLGLQTQITNEFHIRLKHDAPVGPERKKMLEDRYTDIITHGFSNYFGEQRFGVAENNHRIAQDILDGGRKHLPQTEKMFKLQGYASWLFNNYLTHRLKSYKKIHLLDGDLLVERHNPHTYLIYQDDTWSLTTPRKEQGFFVEATPEGECIPPGKGKIDMITGPVIGYNLLLNPKETPAGKLEQARMMHFGLTQEHLHLFKTYKIFGLRRPLRASLIDADMKWQQNDLLLHFTLPKSSYASVVVERLLDDKDTK